MTTYSGRPESAGPCPSCGKVRWVSKKDAKRAARQHMVGDRVHAYRCGGYWHLGHLPPAVVAGRLTRDDIGYAARREPGTTR